MRDGNPRRMGGCVLTFTTQLTGQSAANIPAERRRLAQEMVSADAVELELAATALFLKYENIRDPWEKTKRRKPDKAASGRLDRAKQRDEKLRKIPTPEQLPKSLKSLNLDGTLPSNGVPLRFDNGVIPTPKKLLGLTFPNLTLANRIAERVNGQRGE